MLSRFCQLCIVWWSSQGSLWNQRVGWSWSLSYSGLKRGARAVKKIECQNWHAHQLASAGGKESWWTWTRLQSFLVPCHWATASHWNRQAVGTWESISTAWSTSVCVIRSHRLSAGLALCCCSSFDGFCGPRTERDCWAAFPGPNDSHHITPHPSWSILYDSSSDRSYYCHYHCRHREAPKAHYH